jgi:hypothetical protein
MLEKNVSENDIFRLQDSHSAEVFSARLEEFGRKCPNTMLYLKAIPQRNGYYTHRSVLIVCVIFRESCCAFSFACSYAQVGAATFGWRSSNIGEIGQGRYLGSLRSCHPLDFISGFLRKGNIVISQVTMCLPL